MKPGVGSIETAHAGHLETMLAFVDQQAPDPRETFHAWEAELPPKEREAFAQLKDSAAIRASIVEAFPGCSVHNVDAMNEVYVSNMGAKGSDYVFLQQHIDGPFGFLPFLTLLRCLVVVRGNDRVTTIFSTQKCKNTLRTGQFCWFDYNRDVHYIVKSGDPTSSWKRAASASRCTTRSSRGGSRPFARSSRGGTRRTTCVRGSCSSRARTRGRRSAGSSAPS